MKKPGKKLTKKQKNFKKIAYTGGKFYKSQSYNMDSSRTVDDMIKLLKDIKKDLGGNAVVTMDAGYNNVDMHVFETQAKKLKEIV